MAEYSFRKRKTILVFFMEFPEAELIRKTFTLRQMDLPPNIQFTRKSLIRWFALSIGLITEKESRSTILGVLDAVFFFNFSKKHNPTTVEIQELLSERKTPVSDKLLRYHLKRMIQIGLIERKKLKYHFVSSPYAEKHDYRAGFNHHIASSVQKSLSEIENVLGKLVDNYQAEPK